MSLLLAPAVCRSLCCLLAWSLIAPGGRAQVPSSPAQVASIEAALPERKRVGAAARRTHVPTARLQALLRNAPEAKQSFWGIYVVDLTTEKPVFSHNAEKFFIPASNTKLFSTALALSRLGPDHRFVTRLTADQAPDAEGRVGSLRLIGGGDPNLSGRVIPYAPGEKKANALEVIDAMAEAAVAKGVRQVNGDILGDDTAYYWEPYPDGWATDDAIWEYGAAVSALAPNDAAFEITIEPGSVEGASATIRSHPQIEHMIIHNRTRTVPSASGSIDIARLPGSSELVVTGEIALDAKPKIELLAATDPALFAAQALRESLIKRGVRVSGLARALHRSPDEPEAPPPGPELARHESAPLLEALKVVNKESQNLHAEIMLLETARASAGVGSRKGGLQELGKFLTEAGIASNQYYFQDGSGLSRKNLITPQTITALLTHMDRSRWRDAWLETLPVGGVDGTLTRRFNRLPPNTSVLAKTGTVSHVSTLSGYLVRRDGKRLAFSVMVNNYTHPAAQVRGLIDRIVGELLR